MRFIGHNMKPDEQIFKEKSDMQVTGWQQCGGGGQRNRNQSAKLIQVEYEEELPVVVDVEEALKKGLVNP